MNPGSIFGRIFGTSPLTPMQKHMEKVHACVEKVIPFIEAANAGRWQEAEKLQADISRLEGEADLIKKEIRLHLPKGIFLPVARSDLLEVLSVQDRVANKAKDIAGLMLGRKMMVPEPLREPMVRYLTRCVEATAQARRAINELDELVETGFRGNEVQLVQSMITVLDDIESDTDRMQVELRATLFAIEKDLPPVDVMFAYKIIEWIGDLADLAQRVGSRLQLLLAR